MAVQRVVAERRPGGPGIWVDNVCPSRFFANAFSDPRGHDIELVGMLHDISLSELLMRFAPHDTDRQRALAAYYASASPLVGADGEAKTPASFTDALPGRCRVIEAWALEATPVIRCHDTSDGSLFLAPESEADAIAALNARRRPLSVPGITTRPAHSMRWRCHWFTPAGETLREEDSPWPHGGHPFAVKFYPLVDGEVHPFVEDIIDQQRYINRLITLIDHVMSFSAKGVLLFPENQKPSTLTWAEIAANWSRPNGVIPYAGLQGPKPEQAYSQGGIQGACELLGIEMKLFDQISGVSGALRGESASPTTGAALYQSQIENAAISLLDIYETFASFRSCRDRLIEGSMSQLINIS